MVGPAVRAIDRDASASVVQSWRFLVVAMSETTTVQLRPKGTLALPPAVRAECRLADGDAVDVVDLDGVPFLVPKELAVPHLAAEMESLRKRARVSLKALGGPAREE
jgi:hypothetical protein